MAFTHISYNRSSQFGTKIFSCLSAMESGDDQFKDLRNVIIQMRDGDGSQNVHYAEVTKQFGFGGYVTTQGDPTDEQNAKAKAAFEEIDSYYSKISVNTAVTNVRAAFEQLLDKLRG